MFLIKQHATATVWVLWTLSHIPAAVAGVYIFDWIRKYDSYRFAGVRSKTELHMWLMPLFMVYITGNALVIYRLFPQGYSLLMKSIHALMLTAAVGGGGYGGYCIYISNERYIPKQRDHLKSIHSLFGFTVAILYGVNYFVSLLLYMVARLDQSIRKTLIGFHCYLGFGTFFFIIIAAAAGVQEKIQKFNSQDEQEVGDAVEICIFLYGLAIFMILVNPYFERKKDVWV